MRKKLYGMVFASSIFCVSSVQAEPSPSVQWLMTAPASLFDIGMINLDGFLKYRLGKDVHAFALYDWGKNRISISVIKELNNSDELNEICKNYMIVLRAIGGVVGGKTKNNLTSNFSAQFTHPGYKSSTQPKDTWVTLDNIFDLTVEVSSKGKTVICTGPLLSEDVFIKEK